eukprot:gene11787-8098_t
MLWVGVIIRYIIMNFIYDIFPLSLTVARVLKNAKMHSLTWALLAIKMGTRVIPYYSTTRLTNCTSFLLPSSSATNLIDNIVFHFVSFIQMLFHHCISSSKYA